MAMTDQASAQSSKFDDKSTPGACIRGSISLTAP